MAVVTNLKWMTAILGATIFGLVGPVEAQTAEDDLLKNKTMTIFVGTSVGGGYDAYARLIAAHMGRYIPGRPTLVVKNMPGATGITAANHVFTRSPKDGTELLILAAVTAFAPILGASEATYRPQDMTWIGNVDQTTATCTAWHTSPIKSFKDLLVHSTNFGAGGQTSAASEYARALAVMFGTRIRTIHGYIGSNTVILAMERGELDGGCGLTLSALKSVFKEQYDSGKLRPIIQFARKSDELKDVPHISEFAKTADDLQVTKLVFDRHRLGRAIAGPNGIPVERTQLLRSAFDATMKDAEFLQAAQRSRLDINPMTGDEVDAFVKDLASASPEALAWTKKVLAVGETETVKLKSLDATIATIGGDTIGLQDAAGQSHSVVVSKDETQIMLGGKRAEITALTPGLSCALSYFGEADLAKTIACK